MMTVSSIICILVEISLFFVFSGVQMGFTIDKANIGENNDIIIEVEKVGDTVLTTKVNLTRSYNTTGKSYNFALVLK